MKGLKFTHFHHPMPIVAFNYKTLAAMSTAVCCLIFAARELFLWTVLALFRHGATRAAFSSRVHQFIKLCARYFYSFFSLSFSFSSSSCSYFSPSGLSFTLHCVSLHHLAVQLKRLHWLSWHILFIHPQTQALAPHATWSPESLLRLTPRNINGLLILSFFSSSFPPFFFFFFFSQLPGHAPFWR